MLPTTSKVVRGKSTAKGSTQRMDNAEKTMTKRSMHAPKMDGGGCSNGRLNAPNDRHFLKNNARKSDSNENGKITNQEYSILLKL